MATDIKKLANKFGKKKIVSDQVQRLDSTLGNTQNFSFLNSENTTFGTIPVTPEESVRKSRIPKRGGFGEPLLQGEDALALGLKSIIPISELIGSSVRANRLRKKLPTRFSRVKLSGVPIKDLSRPSFAPRYRTPGGSSLAERTAGLKFGDAFQTAQENQFELQNETFKQNQEAKNIAIGNQEEMVNAQIANQEAGLNTRINLQDYNRSLNRRDVALDALNYYLATDPNQLIQSKNMRELQKANTIVKNPENFNNSQRAWAQNKIVPGGSKKMGGKMKSKFSHGR